MATKGISDKLVTRKKAVLIAAIFIFAIAYRLYRRYKLKANLNISDLISAIAPLTLLALILLAVEYWSRFKKRGRNV